MQDCKYCNQQFLKYELLPICCEIHQLCTLCCLQVIDTYKLNKSCYCCPKYQEFNFQQNMTIEEMNNTDFTCQFQQKYNVYSNSPDSYVFVHKQTLNIYIHTITFAHKYIVDIDNNQFNGFHHSTYKEPILIALEPLNPMYMQVPIKITYDSQLSRYHKRRSFNCIRDKLDSFITPVIDNLIYIPEQIHPNVINTILLNRQPQLNASLQDLGIGTILHISIQQIPVFDNNNNLGNTSDLPNIQQIPSNDNVVLVLHFSYQ